jgi:hypothetical protein
LPSFISGAAISASKFILSFVRYSLMPFSIICAVFCELLPWVLFFFYEIYAATIISHCRQHFFSHSPTPVFITIQFRIYSSSLVPNSYIIVSFYYIWPLYHKIRRDVSSALFLLCRFCERFPTFLFVSSLFVISYYFIQLQPQHIANITYFLHGFDYNINYQVHMTIFQPHIITQQFHIMMSFPKSPILPSHFVELWDILCICCPSVKYYHWSQFCFPWLHHIHIHEVAILSFTIDQYCDVVSTQVIVSYFASSRLHFILSRRPLLAIWKWSNAM